MPQAGPRRQLQVAVTYETPSWQPQQGPSDQQLQVGQAVRWAEVQELCQEALGVQIHQEVPSSGPVRAVAAPLPQPLSYQGPLAQEKAVQ